MLGTPFGSLAGDSTRVRGAANGLARRSGLPLAAERTRGHGLGQRAVEGDREDFLDPVDGQELELLASLFRQFLEIGLILAGEDHLANPGPLRCERLLPQRSEEHTSELQSRENLVCRLLLEKKKKKKKK